MDCPSWCVPGARVRIIDKKKERCYEVGDIGVVTSEAPRELLLNHCRIEPKLGRMAKFDDESWWFTFDMVEPVAKRVMI